MASYTDESLKFNPYVSQLPVEAMVKVGMYKQQKYDEGVQKIQGYIDNIAGMDVARDVDKQYLQSKLNELGNSLKYVAGGDFSNQQLVNSVGGMATQIGKDANVQSAVSSTAWYRKQMAEMEDAIKQGKSSQANIYDFNQKASGWLGSTKVGESFRDRYTQYTDVKKKAMEAIKALHPKLQQYDIPFAIENGQVVLDKKGQKVIADAMQRHKIEGIDEGQIREAIAATLSPDDINQLGIDAKYQFRGVTPEALAQRAINIYESSRKSDIEAIELLTAKKKNTTDPTQLGEIDKNLEYYNSRIGKDGKPGTLQNELAQNLKDAKENPEAVKNSIYKDGFVKEFSNAFSWKQQTMELMKNPIRDQMNWVEEQKLRIQKENRERYEFSVTTGLRKEEIEISRQKMLLDAQANALKKAELYGVDSPWTTIGNPTDNVLRSTEMLAEHSESVANSIETGRKELKTAGYTDAEINMMLNKKMNIPPKAMGTIQNMLKEQNYLKSLQEKDAKLKAEANKEAFNPETLKEVNSINKGNPISLTNWSDGTVTKVNPIDLLSALNDGKATIRKEEGDVVVTYKGKDYSYQEHAFLGIDNIAGRNMREPIKEILKVYNNPNNPIKIRDKIYKEKLAPLVADFVPQIKALGSDKDGSPTAMTLGKVSGLITATIARGVAADNTYDPQVASNMLKDKNAKDTRIFIQQSGDNYEVILKSESNPKKLQRIKLNANEVIANFGAEYVNPHVQESVRLKVGNGNTNLTGKAEDSFMQKAFGDFTGVTRMNITADLDQDVSNRNLYIPSINIMKKDGSWANFTLSGKSKLARVGFDQGKRNLDALTDDNILKSIKLEYPDYDYSQLDIK